MISVRAIVATFCLFIAAGHASANSESFSAVFDFGLSRALQDTIVQQSILDSYDVVYAGGQTVLLPGFDDQGGQRILEKVTLNLETNFSGNVLVDGAIQNTLYDVEIDFLSAARRQLEANAVADPPSQFFVVPAGIIPIDASATGSDMDTNLLPGAWDVDPIDINVVACLMLNYEQFTGVGIPVNPRASGTVEVVYQFRSAVDPTPIPSPAAFGAGLMMLGGLALRRRRGTA